MTPEPAKSARDLLSPGFLDTVSLLSRREITVIAQPLEIQKFFSRLFVEQSTAKVTLLSGETSVPAEISPGFGAEFVERLTLKNETAAPAGTARIVLRWFNEIHVFPVEVPPPSPTREIRLPEKIFTIHRRFCDRRSVEEHGWSVTLKGPHPKQTARGTLADLSDRGVGVRCDAAAARLPLLEEVELTIEIQPGRTLSVKAEVAHLTQADDVHVLAGLRITRAADTAALDDFFKTAAANLFPNVRRARTDEDFEEGADLLTAMAGVAKLPNRAALLQAWKNLGEGPGRPAEIFLERRGKRPAATMTVSRVYSETYLLHTFGIEKRDAFHLPLDMFLGIRDFAIRERGAEFTCGMWPAAHRSMDYYYSEFVRRDFDPADHHFEQVFITRLAPQGAEKNPGRYRTGPGTREDEISAWETVRAASSPVLFEASDWAKKDLKLDGIGEAYRKAGHHRSREIVTGKDGDALLAFACVEISTGGAGVFGLANSFRIYFTRGGETRADERQAIATALIGEVLRRYASHGIEACCLYGEKAWDWLSTVPGYQATLGSTCLWIVRRTRAKAFLRHLERVNWELGLFRGGKVRVRPSVLKAFDYRTEPFKPRRCMRLEDPAGIPGVTCTLQSSSGAECDGVPVNLDTYGASVILKKPVPLRSGEEIGLRLTLEDAPALELKAIVRHAESRVAPGFQAEVMVAGVEFLGAPTSHLEAIREFVFARLNPDIRLLREEDFEPLAQLLDKAKYFDYFESTDHQQLIQAAAPTYKALPSLYPDLARTTVLPGDDGVIGSHSFYRLNSKTWQLHQLAVDPNLSLYKSKLPTKTVLQSTFQYLCLDPEAEYFVTYFSDDAPIARAYFEAGHAHYDARDYAFIPLRWWFVEKPEKCAIEDIAPHCSEATKDDLLSVAEYLLSIVPAIEYDALAFSDPPLKSFLPEWKRAGTDRQRRVFVARDKRNEIRVFALADVGPSGLNILGVLDKFRLFDVPWCGVDVRQLRLDLAKYVIAQYARERRSRVYIELDERDVIDYSSVGAKDVTRNWRLVAHRRCFITALQFFLARYGKLEERLLSQEKTPISLREIERSSDKA